MARLAESLESFGLPVHWDGELITPVGRQNVRLWVRLEGGQQLGWRSGIDGTLELVADLERVSRDHTLQALLSRLTRAYAARQALDELVVDGIRTNAALHRELVTDTSFIAGGVSIHYLESKLEHEH